METKSDFPDMENVSHAILLEKINSLKQIILKAILDEISPLRSLVEYSSNNIDSRLIRLECRLEAALEIHPDRRLHESIHRKSGNIDSLAESKTISLDQIGPLVSIENGRSEADEHPFYTAENGLTETRAATKLDDDYESDRHPLPKLSLGQILNAQSVFLNDEAANASTDIANALSADADNSTTTSRTSSVATDNRIEHAAAPMPSEIVSCTNLPADNSSTEENPPSALRLSAIGDARAVDESQSCQGINNGERAEGGGSTVGGAFLRAVLASTRSGKSLLGEGSMAIYGHSEMARKVVEY